MLHHVITLVTNLASNEPDFNNLTNEVVKWLNAFLIPVFTILGGFSIFKLISLGWKISHSSDQPDDRRIAVQGLIWWGIGLTLAIAAPLIINLLIPALMNASGGGYSPPTL